MSDDRGPASVPANATQTSDEDNVRAVVEAWALAVRNGDMAGVLAHHADSIVMFDVPVPLHNRGRDAYRQAWELFFAAQGKGAFDLGELEIVAGDDVAFCHSIVTCGGLDPANQFPVRLTLGLRKIDGAWTITHEHHSVPAV